MKLEKRQAARLSIEIDDATAAMRRAKHEAKEGRGADAMRALDVAEQHMKAARAVLAQVNGDAA